MPINTLTIDTECTKLPVSFPWQEGARICSIGLAFNDEEAKVFILDHKTEPVAPQRDAFREIQEYIDKADLIIAHNAKFDINWFKWLGLDLTEKKIWCTLAVDYLINGQYRLKYDLNSVATRHGFGTKLDLMKKYWEDGYETDEIPLEVHIPYLTQDVLLTRDIYKSQKAMVTANGLSQIVEVTCEVTDILSDMEVLGVKFDKQSALRFHSEFTEQLRICDNNIIEFVGESFNLGSSRQLSAHLYGGTYPIDGRETYTVTLKDGTVKERSRKCRLNKVVQGFGFKPLDGTESDSTPGVYGTGVKVLKLLTAETDEQKKILDLLKERSRVGKIIEMFMSKDEDGGLIPSIGKDGRIHTQFNQNTTVTGRLSSKIPNLQNLPRKGTNPIKRCFFSNNGCMINLDLAQIEFRVAAELSRDPVMLKELKDGLDTHADNAIRFFDAGKYAKDSDEFKKLRTAAKIFTFRLLYGGGANGFFRDGSMPRFSLKRWQSIVEAYYEKYKGLRTWQQENVNKVYEQGYLRNPSGRILRFVPTIQHGVMQYDEKPIYNYPVQSASSDVMYLAMAVIRRRFRDNGFRSKFVLQVHDSLVIDAYPEEVDKICDLGVAVFRELPNLCKLYWGWDVVVPLDGDCEVGLTYGDTIGYISNPEATCCSLKCEKDNVFSDILVPVTTYVDLIKHPDYISACKEYNITKIKFVKMENK
jgi:DNA polymerase I